MGKRESLANAPEQLAFEQGATSANKDTIAAHENAEAELLKTAKTFRIAVSGDVLVTQLELDVIGTATFQRLRGVRQLGNVFHVFPTALHTRFDHSLGTLEMADRMIKAIKTNSASTSDERSITLMQEVLARLYALLHDVTHIPFGHTIEDELQLLKRHDENPSRILEFLGPASEIGQLIDSRLGAEAYNRFMRVFLWEEKEAKQNERMSDPAWEPLRRWLVPGEQDDDIFIHDLVSNTACADLLDYVARDDYFCNLAIGLEYRFIRFLYLSRPHGSKHRRVFVRLWKGRQLAPRRDTMTDLARLLEARYMIAERAYFHHAKIISGAMLGRALQELLLAGRLSERDLYSHSDDTLLAAMRDSDLPIVGRLGAALVQRRLYKRIGKPFGAADFDAVDSEDVKGSAKKAALQALLNADSRRRIENEFADRVAVPHGDVLIYAPALDMNPKAADMNVRWHGQDLKFRQIDDPVLAPRLKQIIDAHHMLWNIQLLATREVAAAKERRDLLVHAFQTEFLCSAAEANERRHRHHEKLIEFRLDQNDYKLPALAYADLRKRISEAASALGVTAKEDRSLDQRIKAAIEKFVVAG